MTAFNQVMYDDLATKSMDVYAHTKYKILLDYLKDQPSLSILNAGCGSGELSVLLAEAGHRVVGIEPEPAYAELATRNTAHLSPNQCCIKVASIEEYVSPTLFDCVVSTDVLEHIEDHHTAFDRLVSLVRPGGLVLLALPAGPWLFGYHDEQFGHFRRYSKTTLRALVQDHCGVEALRYFGFSLIPVCYLYSRLWRKPYPVQGQGGNGQKRSWMARILETMLELDRFVPMPLGTSVLLKARRKLTADSKAA